MLPVITQLKSFVCHFENDAITIQKFCNYLAKTDPTSEKQVMRDLYSAMNVYINNSGTVSCFDFSDESMYTFSYSSNDDTAFNYQVIQLISAQIGELNVANHGNYFGILQACTELIDPSCDDGVHDFFEPEPWNFEEFSQQCYETYHVKPDADRMDLFFGGKDITASSNIVFSNGLLDPWYAYGVLRNVSESLIAITIPDAAHHLDLRSRNDADPPAVLAAREMEKYYIKKWIGEFGKNREVIRNSFANFDFN